MVVLVPSKNLMFVMTTDTRYSANDDLWESFVERYLVPAAK